MSKFLFISTLMLAQTIFGLDFNKDVKPILSRKCFSCHNKEKQKGKLRLDARESALKSLISKDGKTPELISRIYHRDQDEIMPPPEKGKLSDPEKKILKEWVESGSKYDKHWAFVPPKEISPPTVKSEWINNEIDQFILKKLNDHKIPPNPVVFDYRLLRRVSFILTGLPPDQEDLDKLSAEKLEYDDYVKNLLNSPEYGEHMATFWLDGARYGDTNGIEYDNSRPIWPYRDWVIKAFNDNMPYNQFLIEQIAGDLIPDASLTQKVATGFLRCNVSTNEQGSIEEEFQALNAKDRLNTTMAVTTGLTVECAECHDHKYDPVSQKEYYQLLAYFNNIDGNAVGQPFDRSDAPLTPIVKKDQFKLISSWEQRKAEAEKEISKIKSKAQDDFWWWHYKQQTQPDPAIFLIGKLDNYFPLDEKDGSFTYNLITEHKCNIKGLMSRLKGRFGNSQGFRGSSLIDCLNVAKYDKNSKFTIGCWLLPEENNDGTILAKFDTQLKKGWKMTITKNILSFNMNSSENHGILVEIKNPLITNKWSHLAVTFNGTGKAEGIKVFIDAKEVELKIISDSLNESILVSGNVRIGNESISNPLVAVKVDEVFTAKFELNSKQIESISNFNSAYRFALIPPDKINEENKAVLYDYYIKFEHPVTSKLYSEIQRLESNTEAVLKSSVTSMVMKEKINPLETFIMDRGNYASPLDKVERGTPAFLPSLKDNHPANRLGLAQWLTDKNHPLTARFLVNRIWQQLFGKGLVSTISDFGTQGDFPTHPDLLDFLANYLVENNWDIKKLITKIVSSSTFKQASLVSSHAKKVDPENNLYSHFNKQRLTAESIRDQALKLSGKLNRKLYGKPAFPLQPPNLWAEVTADISNTFNYHQSEGEDNYRRSVYTFWKRNFPPPAMFIFDAPTRQTCILTRKVSNTPNQALALLNDRQFTGLYNEISNIVKSKVSTNEDTVDSLFKTLLYRSPTSEERKICIEYLNKNKKSNIHFLVKILMNLDETISLE